MSDPIERMIERCSIRQQAWERPEPRPALELAGEAARPRQKSVDYDTWITRDGRVIVVRDMSDNHLENAIKQVERFIDPTPRMRGMYRALLTERDRRHLASSTAPTPSGGVEYVFRDGSACSISDLTDSELGGLQDAARTELERRRTHPIIKSAFEISCGTCDNQELLARLQTLQRLLRDRGIAA